MGFVDIIGVQMDLGASKRGVSMGPMAIRYGGLQEGLEALGYTVLDEGDIVPPAEGKSLPELRYYEQVVDVNRRLYSFHIELEGYAPNGNNTTGMIFLRKVD